MKTFGKTYIRVLDHLLGVEKHLSVFFSEQSLQSGITIKYWLQNEQVLVKTNSVQYIGGCWP